MPTRQEMWDRLGSPVDLLVVGGGITGTGIARDAARRGMSVALVEMRDLAYGTSSRSSKLVHGGLRYLEHYEFSLVFESVSERRILMDIAPHLVNPLGFLFPVFKGSRQKLWVINTGMWLYDGLSLFRSPKLHRTLTPGQVAQEEPTLVRTSLQGAPLYYDCSTNDARLTLENGLDAAQAGATVATWARVVAFTKDENGRITGAEIEDAFTGARKLVQAHAVINATGPWTDSTIALGKSVGGDLLRPTKGVHLVVRHDRLPVRNAVVCFHPTDGRVLFAIPWEDCTYIGTTDTDYHGDPADVVATRSDVDYLIDACAAYFPGNLLTHADVIATWAGLRPLIRPESKPGVDVDESAVSREHRIIVGRDGLITIAGGKLTTYRRMAAEVVDTATKLLRLSNNVSAPLGTSDTDREPLPGAVGWPEDDDHERVAQQVAQASGAQVALDTARHLANTYGMRGVDIARLVRAQPALGARLIEGRPEIVAQVDWAVNEELAATCTDFLMRRTQLYYKADDPGLGARDAVADRLAELLAWTAEQRAESAAAYRAEVEASRRWRTEA